MLLRRLSWRLTHTHRHQAALLTSSTHSTHKHERQQQQQQQQESRHRPHFYEQDRLTVNRTEQKEKENDIKHQSTQHSTQHGTHPAHHTTSPKTHSARLYEDIDEETQTQMQTETDTQREERRTPADVPSSSSPSDPDDSTDFEYLLHKDPALIERINSINITPPTTPEFGVYAPTTRIAKNREEYEALKPKQRTAMGPLILTPTRDKLTPLQLQRLLALHAINPTYYHIEMLADRFQVNADIVSKIVNHMSAVRVFPMKNEEGQEELIGVVDVNDLPEDQQAAQIAGEHTVKHIITWEKKQQQQITDTQVR